ncbi:mycofactocin biosynthesis chaperone MftB [Saccharopolyspora gloriosae]|uniref:mycofactocin biosynthesis chaperone MftB n=1 Tax=Saccharopolyspora gloriosae TaxID=455344 RepID=UPI001FB59CD6|nr:mycofactocin biosynthesis chaperone MftB [Saccharopolyspora gloriosae]
MACAASTESGAATGFDPGRPHRLSPGVSLRPERFGALVYDFTTRRLSFLKTTELVAVVRELENQPDVHSALTETGVPAEQHPRYLEALAGLHDKGTIRLRD